MPKIRKKSSKRSTTRLREKIKDRSSEHRRKEKRNAKKDVTWKSKSKADPGIPRLFPGKERILEEIQQAKRDKEAAKREQREKQHQPEPSTAETMAELAEQTAADAAALDIENELLEADEDDPIASTSSSLRAHARSLRAVLERSDVIIEVLDARDPAGTRSRQIERELLRMPGDKKLVLVLNKIDLVPRENVEAWLAHLRKSFPALPFKSSTQEQRRNLSSGSSSAATATIAAATSTKPLISLLKNYARSGGAKKQTLTCGVIGMPNVGKSSLINTLKRSRACGVAPTPGFTKDVQEVSLDAGLKILDCPGVVLEGGDEDPEKVLRNALRIEQVEDPIGPVEVILRRCRPEHLMIVYNIPAFTTTNEFLLGVARVRGRLRKGTARSILRDWNAGRIPYYTLAPVEPVASSTEPVASTSKPSTSTVSTDIGSAAIVTSFAPEFDLDALFGEADAEALSTLKSTKDTKGTLKLKADDPVVEETAMDEDPSAGRMRLFGEAESDDDDDEDGWEDADMGAEEDNGFVVPPPSKKTKRSADEAALDGSGVVSMAPKNRKVAFAAEHLGPTPTGSASQRQKLFAEGSVEAPPVSLNKRQKLDAKKNKKAARREQKRDQDGTVTLEKQTGLLTVEDEDADPNGAYDFAAFFSKADAGAGTIREADSDEEEEDEEEL